MLKKIKKFFEPINTKYLYQSQELIFSKQLENLIPNLKNDFLKVHGNLEYLTPKKFDSSIPFHGQEQKSGWRSVGIKFYHKWEKSQKDLEKLYPTAHKLAKLFGDDCALATYSLLRPGGKISLHNGKDHNYDSAYLRIHIPLIIPDGDTDILGFEIMGQRIGWKNIWAINNTGLHQVYNKTSDHRLIFILDVHKSVLGQSPNYENMFQNRKLESLRLHLNRIIRIIYFNFFNKKS